MISEDEGKITFGIYLTKIKICRCGVIPYTLHDNKLYYLLARDKNTKELGDFGGGVKKTEGALSGGLREFSEESMGIFNDLYKNLDERTKDIAIVNGQMAILFVPIEIEWLKKASLIFNSILKEKKMYPSDEISELVWVNENDFNNLIFSLEKVNGNKMWIKVKKFLKNFYLPGVNLWGGIGKGIKLVDILKIAALRRKIN